jgi:hypothetical protein
VVRRDGLDFVAVVQALTFVLLDEEGHCRDKEARGKTTTFTGGAVRAWTIESVDQRPNIDFHIPLPGAGMSHETAPENVCRIS